MKVRPGFLIALGLAMLLFILSSTAAHRAELAAAIKDASVARQQVVAALVRADAAEKFAAANDLFISQAETDRRAAEKARDVWKKRFDSLATAAPDTCRPVVEAADSALAATDSALAASQREVKTLQSSLTAVRAASLALRPPVLNLVNATKQLEVTAAKATGFAFRHGPAITLGVDATGAPRAVIGYTFCLCK